ncbi:STAS domain-containing protein [Eilatimonas milleporae]|uniref:Anti-sigma-factor antagonist n=1 Tax=Eilatimonas milleporae TaxID=911205 RepID=A0A3M0CNB8_9PROT|nr:STAS domain-containing protein [Eilatimonas milleporae]RMB08379.1 anti-sigma-factor antagonist [Eilatimonas milleporae]
MEYRIVENGDDVNVVFQGDITFSENVAFRRLMRELEEKNFGRCVLDLSDVGMIDSAGLGMFLIAKEQSENGGWKLGMRGAHGHVESMLKLTKLSELLEEVD